MHATATQQGGTFHLQGWYFHICRIAPFQTLDVGLFHELVGFQLGQVFGKRFRTGCVPVDFQHGLHDVDVSISIRRRGLKVQRYRDVTVQLENFNVCLNSILCPDGVVSFKFQFS